MVDRGDQPHGGKPITGRTVLIWIIGFFAVIFAANGVFIYLALGSFPGVVVESSYKAGQAYNQEIAEAKAQADRGWQVSASLQKGTGENGLLRVEPKDRNGKILTGLSFTATLEHPTNLEGDMRLALQEIESGVYQGIAENLTGGSWDLILEAHEGDQRVFRSHNRVFVSE